MKYIVGIGELLWDMLPEGKKIGGAPGNFAFHAAQMGFNSLVISALGGDALGEELLDELNVKKLNAITPKVDYPTGTVLIELDDQGVPVYEIKQNVAWDNIPYSDELDVIAKNTVAVAFGSLAQRGAISHATITKFLDAMCDDCYKIFDINLRQGFYTKEIIEESLKRCNILKINDEELVIVSRLFEYSGTDLQEKCQQLLDDYKLRKLILTCGVNGSYVFSREGVSFVETPKVEVADTVGAGDSFTASFICSLLKGRTLVESHVKAVEVSAYVCTQNGAMPSLGELEL